MIRWEGSERPTLDVLAEDAVRSYPRQRLLSTLARIVRQWAGEEGVRCSHAESERAAEAAFRSARP